jgi:hypothetical protein
MLARDRGRLEQNCRNGFESNISELHRVKNNTDQKRVLGALDDARRILGEYIEPGPREATRTVERLLAVLDNEKFVCALDRMNRRSALHLVE